MAGYIGSKAVNLSTTGADINGDANIDGDLSFGDNDKAIFGAGSDLQIYHDGSNSNIYDGGTGNLILKTNGTALNIQDGNNKILGNFNGTLGAVYLNHVSGGVSSTRLATTSTGVDITGTLTSDGLTVDGDVTLGGGTNEVLFNTNSGNAPVYFSRTSVTDEALTIVVDDANVTFNSIQDERYGGYEFTSTYSGVGTRTRLSIGTNTGDISFYEDTGTTPKFFWDASAESLGIGTSSPTEKLTVTGGNIQVDASSRKIGFKLSGNNNAGYLIPYDSSGNTQLVNERSGGNLIFKTANTEAMRIDSSGNLLVGTTSTGAASGGSGTSGININASGAIEVARSANPVMFLNRTTSDGTIAEFRKDGSTVGSIGVYNADNLYIQGAANHSGLGFGSSQIHPYRNGVEIDNTIDMGAAASRFDDIYATNGTIQTSDRNEKQDIAELTDAEQRVAVAAKGLMRKFRWRDAVEAKGDAARTHFGIIAQDLQAAFAAEGLDAGDYAMFISTTWWETQTEVPAVEAVAEVLDEDGNVVTEAVEAVDAYTRTDTYDTQEEAPEGATERTRLGVRYSELLAFIIGAL